MQARLQMSEMHAVTTIWFSALTKKVSSCARSHLGFSPQVEVQDPSRQRMANSCR